MRILRSGTSDQGEIQAAIELLRKTGSLDYARGEMRRLVSEVVREMDMHFAGRSDTVALELLKEMA